MLLLQQGRVGTRMLHAPQAAMAAAMQRPSRAWPQQQQQQQLWHLSLFSYLHQLLLVVEEAEA